MKSEYRRNGRVIVRRGLALSLGLWLVLVVGALPQAAQAQGVSSEASQAFVEWLFPRFFGRDGTPAQIAQRAGWIDTCASTPTLVVVTFHHNPSFLGDTAAVARLYSAALGRTPDWAGLDYWVGQFRAGLPLADIAESFAGSSEFNARYGSLSNRAFVEALYQNTLGRPGDPDGIDFWTRQLDTRTRGQVLLSISESPEHQARTAGVMQTVLLRYALTDAIPPLPLNDPSPPQPLQEEIDAVLALESYLGPPIPIYPCAE